MLFHGVEVTVVVEKLQVIFQAASADQEINGFADGDALPAQTPVHFGRFDCQIAIQGIDAAKPVECLAGPNHIPVASKTAQHFDIDDVTDDNLGLRLEQFT